jgi:hypothetical protein
MRAPGTSAHTCAVHPGGTRSVRGVANAPPPRPAGTARRTEADAATGRAGLAAADADADADAGGEEADGDGACVAGDEAGADPPQAAIAPHAAISAPVTSGNRPRHPGGRTPAGPAPVRMCSVHHPRDGYVTASAVRA